MEIFYSIAPKMIIALGILSVLTGLLIYFSCRCIPAWKPAKNLLNNPVYKKFFKTHCNLWWIFWVLVIIHAAIAWLYIFA
jgi:cytochrome b561